jgi:uncharacterized protein YukE
MANDLDHGDDDFEAFSSEGESQTWSSLMRYTAKLSKYRPIIKAKKAMISRTLPDAKDIAKIRHNWQGDYRLTFHNEIAQWKRTRAEAFLQMDLAADGDERSPDEDIRKKVAGDTANRKWQELEQ